MTGETNAEFVMDFIFALHKEHHRVNSHYPESDMDVIAYKDGLYFAEKVISDMYSAITVVESQAIQ